MIYFVAILSKVFGVSITWECQCIQESLESLVLMSLSISYLSSV